MIKGKLIKGFTINGLIGITVLAFSPQGPAEMAEGKIQPLRKIENKAFKRGEKLKYRVHYGVVDAGNATLEITADTTKIAKRSTYHMVAKGFTNKAWDAIFPVRDTYESYVDQESILPFFHKRRVNENGYIINHDVAFNQYNHEALANQKKYKTDTNVQDMVSAFYYARVLDFAHAKTGDLFVVSTFFDFENFPLKIKYMGTEVIKTDLGKIKCYKFHPVVQKGRVFKTEEDMTVWLSADDSKVPVRVQTNILVGSIKMDLIEYSGLTSTLNKVK
ncbi:MAG: DUF3108 domain-containing protein [Flavobacteriales bacterium]